MRVTFFSLFDKAYQGQVKMSCKERRERACEVLGFVGKGVMWYVHVDLF
jgi:hypothetical protein